LPHQRGFFFLGFCFGFGGREEGGHRVFLANWVSNSCLLSVWTILK
jgi:hypothetical protein